MPKYIAILRGINVGGKRKILMGDLREMFHKMGFINTQTYIQSGNVIFESSEAIEAIQISEMIKTAIQKKFGHDVPIIVRTSGEIRQAVLNNPFLKKGHEIERLYLTFLKEKPDLEHLEKIKQYDYSPDQYEISGNHIFGFCAGKYSETKYTNTFFEAKLKVAATTRNWKTVRKLFELATSD